MPSFEINQGVAKNMIGSIPSQNVKEKIYAEFSRLHNSAMEQINSLHDPSQSEAGIQTETGNLIAELIKAHENFIDRMRTFGLRQDRLQLETRARELLEKEAEIEKHIEQRNGDRMCGVDGPVKRDSRF